MLQKSLQPGIVEAEICRAQRMEVVGQLTGGVVHDFNNILTVIAGTIDILAEGVADQPELAAIAGLISEAAARGANLTSHLLAFARGQPSPPRDVDVNSLLVDAARLLRPTLGEHIAIESSLTAGIPSVFVDPSQLMTALLDLAILARDAMPEGGKLVFESGHADDGHIGADAGASAEDGVVVTVNARASDHPVQAHVDLSLVQDLVRKTSCRVRVDHEADGTSVRIHLPRAKGCVRPPEDAAGAGGDELILIVEDDALVRRYVVTQVQSLGYRTLAAGNASEALEIVGQGERIDLLFTDVIMPGSINGRRLAVEAVNRVPSLKVLYTSGYAGTALIQEGRLEADALLLAKPYRKVDLAKMIRAALTRVAI